MVLGVVNPVCSCILLLVNPVSCAILLLSAFGMAPLILLLLLSSSYITLGFAIASGAVVVKGELEAIRSKDALR